jgi:predicted 2-oxoglutarate/Fe(II)-dependent dioxygenase YbiX
MLTQYADSQTYTDLDVVDPEKSTMDTIVTLKDEGRITHHVDIDGMAYQIISIFNDMHCNRMAPFYDVNFEWYERPQILRYPPGGKYNQHADADHWVAEKDEWVRVQDRDYSVLLYLNDQYEGGELELVNQKFSIKPKPGMLLAFPSDHRYLHAALPTRSGIRYVIVSWAAIVGSRRVRKQMPYASVYIRQKRLA